MALGSHTFPQQEYHSLLHTTFSIPGYRRSRSAASGGWVAPGVQGPVELGGESFKLLIAHYVPRSDLRQARCRPESCQPIGTSATSRGDPRHVCFSNRPFGVKRFQTTHHYSVDVARGLVLLFGIGTKALPSWDSKIRWNNLPGGLAVKQTVGPSGHANSPHPSSREGHHSTARWSSSFPPMLMPWPVPGSSGTRCRQPRCGVGSQPADAPARRSPSSSHGAWRSASPRP